MRDPAEVQVKKVALQRNVISVTKGLGGRLCSSACNVTCVSLCCTCVSLVCHKVSLEHPGTWVLYDYWRSVPLPWGPHTAIFNPDKASFLKSILKG